jgi:hypothetical protein
LYICWRISNGVFCTFGIAMASGPSALMIDERYDDDDDDDEVRNKIASAEK